MAARTAERAGGVVPRRATWTVVALAVAFLVAGCGSESTSGTTTATVGDGTEMAPGEAHVIGLTEVVGADGKDLTVMTGAMPAEDATGACAIDSIEPVITEDAMGISLEFAVMSDASRFFEECETQPRQVTVTLGEPVRERNITSAWGGTFWWDEDGWVGCATVVMTCVTDPASCDGSTLRDTISNNDVPQGFGMDSRCEEPWAVVDIDVGAAACPATGEPGNPCAGRSIRRVYLEIQDETWVVVGNDDGPGCGAIPEHLRAFPTALCEDLPAV